MSSFGNYTEGIGTLKAAGGDLGGERNISDNLSESDGAIDGK